MIALQILSKVLQTKDNSIIEDNFLTAEYFVGYEKEYEFIQDHIRKYGTIPDKATFVAQFPECELVDVTETDRYLVETAQEEYLYHKSVPVLQKAADLLKTDSNAAAEYLVSAMKTLQPNTGAIGADIVATAEERVDHSLDRATNQDKWYFSTGFKELDDVTHGIQRGEELFVIFARTNQGKSWIMEKMCVNVWEDNHNVGYISPEMGADSIGYRFDTLHQHFSNRGMMWGNGDIDYTEYRDYAKNLATAENKFIVATPKDFDNKLTVSRIKNWAVRNALDLVAIDGITYMHDERYKRGDNKTTSLTNISEDLMSLSVELQIPILVVVQANRTGVVEKGAEATPELESIRDSDGISHNASKVLSIHQVENNTLVMTVKKQRLGKVGTKVKYDWNIDTGLFSFVPDNADDDDSYYDEPTTRQEKKNGTKADLF